VAVGVAGAAAGGGAVAMASTDHATSPAKAPEAARDHDRTGGPGFQGDATAATGTTPAATAPRASSGAADPRRPCRAPAT
jgi:hypothetical protein